MLDEAASGEGGAGNKVAKGENCASHLYGRGYSEGTRRHNGKGDESPIGSAEDSSSNRIS